MSRDRRRRERERDRAFVSGDPHALRRVVAEAEARGDAETLLEVADLARELGLHPVEWAAARRLREVAARRRARDKSALDARILEAIIALDPERLARHARHKPSALDDVSAAAGRLLGPRRVIAVIERFSSEHEELDHRYAAANERYRKAARRRALVAGPLQTFARFRDEDQAPARAHDLADLVRSFGVGAIVLHDSRKPRSDWIVLAGVEGDDDLELLRLLVRIRAAERGD